VSFSTLVQPADDLTYFQSMENVVQKTLKPNDKVSLPNNKMSAQLSPRPLELI
jgi:hypothetical protein